MGLAQAARVAARWLGANELNAEGMVESLNRELDPLFKDFMFKVYRPTSLGGEDNVYISFARAAKGSGELDALNSPTQIMISIDGTGWKKGQPAPAKLEAKQFRGRGVKMRAKSGPPAAILKYVGDWFKANAKALKGEE